VGIFGREQAGRARLTICENLRGLGEPTLRGSVIVADRVGTTCPRVQPSSMQPRGVHACVERVGGGPPTLQTAKICVGSGSPLYAAR
jgi:hypothetical protein